MPERLVITGMGAVTPLGVGVEAYWQGLVGGRCGIGEIRRFDASALPVQRAAEVRDFQPKDYLPTRLVMDLEPFMQYAYVSAEEALRQSGLDTRSDRVGVVMGTALGGIGLIGETHARFVSEGRQAGPKFLTKAMGNIAAAQLSIAWGMRGPSLTVSTACSSGGDALSVAEMLLRAGKADAMLVMAGEAAICPTLIQSLCKTGALSRTGESRPFDKDRNGFVLGEGGGALLLEREESALRRGAEILGVLLGSANCADAYNPVSPQPEGEGAAACMSLALADAGIAADAVDYVNAHGTATHMGDVAEARALRRVFGAREVLVSSTKGATGHLMGAGGLTETIACVKAVQTGIAPPNLGYATPDPECPLRIVTDVQKRPLRTAMSNAMGFGGQNSCVLVGAYRE